MKEAIRQVLLLSLLLLFAASFSYAQMSGGYTINAGAPASATNYQNFVSAVNDLNLGTRTDGGPAQGPGVSGAVTFTVSAGTYNERVNLNAVTGSSTTNVITFDGVDPDTRTLTWTSNTTNDYTFRLNGADNIRIINLGVANPGATYGYGIQMISNCVNNEISGCKVTLPNASGGYKVGIIGATYFSTNALNVTDVTIKNNEIIGGRHGIAATGPTNTQSTGLVLDSNVITQSYYSGIYLEDINQPHVHGNEITMGTTYLFNRPLYFRSCSRMDVAYNKLQNVGTYGIYMLSCNFNTNDEIRIYNNWIGGNFISTGTAYGIYMSSCRYTKIVNNSIWVDNPGSGSRGVYITGSQSTNNDLINNSIAATGSAGTNYVYYILNQNYIGTVDHNNLYSTSEGSIYAYLQGSYATLGALQGAFAAYNQNSQNNNPNYFGANDLHTFGPPLNNWGFNVPWVTDDIDGQSRPLAPDVIKDVGADEHVLPPFDADIWDLVSPLVLTVGNNNVTVQIQNNGNNSLNGIPLTLQYSTDGGTTWSVTEVFTPTTLGTSGGQQNFTFSTPWNVTTAGNYVLCVRINPQITGDPDASDQICQNVCTGMSGAYTINSAAPTAGNNFNSFSDAATALSSCGITGPVTIDVTPGTYTDQFLLNNVIGTSPTNTITVDGGDAATTTIQQSFSSTNQEIILLNGTQHTTIKNLTVNLTGNYGYGFHLRNQADFNVIDSCVINVPTSTLSAYNIGIVFAENQYSTFGNTANNCTISNNTITGGYYGMRLNGISSTTYTQNNKVINNTVTDFYFYGIFTYYQEHIEVENNYVYGNPNIGSASSYGIYNYYPHGDFRIVGNRVHSVGRYASYTGYANRYNSGKGLIANNMFGGDFYSTSFAYAMYLLNPYDVDIVNNSCHLDGYSGYACYMSLSTSFADSIRVCNNIFSGGGAFPGQGGMAIRVTNTAPIDEMDYNNFFTNGPILAQWGSPTYTTLGAWQTTFPALNQNSVEILPGFISGTDLHIVCSNADNLGKVTPLVNDDFDDQARSTTTPDIGADEYTGITISMDLGADTTHCDPLFIYGDTNQYVGFLWGGGQTSPGLFVDSTDVYALTVTDSNNCQATDSVLVTVLTLPGRPYGNDTIDQCSYDSLDAGNPGSTYLWSTTDTTQVIYPSSSGTYEVEITSADGCVNTDTVTVNFFADAVAQLGPDTTFCLGLGYLLDAGSGPTGTSYTWTSGSTTQQVLVTAPGLYGVTVTTPNGCVATDSVEMNALLAPVVNLGPDRTECDDWTLDAGSAGVTYNWSTGSTAQTITGTQPGTYSVTVTNANGCPATDQVMIGMGTTPTVNIGQPPVLCQGQTVNLNAGNPGFGYLWSNGATTQSITVGQAGTYIVEVTDPQSSCVGSDTVLVTQSFLNVNLGPDLTLCDGESATLDAGTGPTGYLWNNGSTGQTITTSSGGTFSVQVTDALGCTATDQVVIATAPAPNASFTSPGVAPLFGTVQFNGNSTSNITSWDWDFGDGSTATGQNPTHNFVAMGSFNVCLTASDGTCETTVCNVFTVSDPVEIEDEIFTAGVKVFPNPNAGEFSIDFDLPKFMDVNLEIMNLTGQTIYASELSGVRVHREEVNLSQPAAGMYFLRVTSNKGNEMIRKIIIE
ncbi:MAG: right-handed parallel beta-helix repeat-containing protein [Bacteroidota bacterium]